MNLTRFAQAELQRAGLFDKDSDYEGLIGKSVMEIIETFKKQGHSIASARLVIQALDKLLWFQPLTPSTFEDDEWEEYTRSVCTGEMIYRSRRDPHCFKIGKKGNPRWDIYGRHGI